MKFIKIGDVPIDASKTLDYFYVELSKLEKGIQKEIDFMRKTVGEERFGHVRESVLEIVDLIEAKTSALPPLVEEMNAAFQKTIKIPVTSTPEEAGVEE
jgi:hypothetical protein